MYLCCKKIDDRDMYVGDGLYVRADRVTEYGGRVDDDDTRYERAVEAELLEDEGIHGGRAASPPQKFTPRRYLLMASIRLSYTAGAAGLASIPHPHLRALPCQTPR
jgi:hypothetical protein